MDIFSLSGLELMHPQYLLQLLFRFLIDLVTLYFVVGVLYFRVRRNRGYVFTFVLFNTVIFFVCFLLNHLSLSIGFSFGIFAIFSILRYRTASIPIKEMTYLFVAISIAVINALAGQGIGIIEVVTVNLCIVGISFAVERLWMRNELYKNIRYEKIEFIKPQHREKLLADVRERTGLNIHRIEIGRIDFLRDIADLRVYYSANADEHFTEEEDGNDDE